MPSVSTPADLHIANQLRLADGDLKDAIVLHNCRSRNDAYHLEQAAEKNCSMLCSRPKDRTFRSEIPICLTVLPTDFL